MIRLKLPILVWDHRPVTNAQRRASLRVMRRVGAFIRRTAQNLTRHRKKKSSKAQRQGRPAGKMLQTGPPVSHTGILRKNILFYAEPDGQSVIVGPRALGGKAGSLEHLEHGGTTTLQRRGGRVRAVYQPRPFMGPALQQEIPKLPQMWKDAIR